jgi:hypothetical protein
MSHVLPEEFEWRFRNLSRIMRWFHANQIDPYAVPIDGHVVWDNDVIVYGTGRTTPLLRRWGGFRSFGPDRLCTHGVRRRNGSTD